MDKIEIAEGLFYDNSLSLEQNIENKDVELFVMQLLENETKRITKDVVGKGSKTWKQIQSIEYTLNNFKMILKLKYKNSTNAKGLKSTYKLELI